MKRFSGNFAIRIPQFAMSLSCILHHVSCIMHPTSCKSAMPFLATFYLLFATFTYAQSGWGQDTRLVFMQGGGWYPRAACCGDTIHLVWWQAYVGHDEVFYKRSTDAGNTWGEDVMLSVEDGQSSTMPQIAATHNMIHVVWFEDDYGLLYRRSTNGGITWQNIDSIVPGMVYSSIQAIGDTVYIAGTVGSIPVLRFTKSTDGGNTWQPIQDVCSASDSPTLRIISNEIVVVVITYEYSPEIYNIRSFNGGQTWLDSQLVSEGVASGSQMPALDTDDSAGIHITWYDYKYSPYPWTGDIFYRASRDSGSTWEEIDSLTVMHRAVASDILAESTNLHLVWEDDRNGFDNNFEIYYRMSTDLGRSWGPEERLTNAPYHSYCPSLACGGGYLHLFWQDRREYGNNGPSAPIYYKRKDLSWGISEAEQVSASPRIKVEVYPNPFSHEIEIGYRIQDARYTIQDISIKIFDVSGKEVGYGIMRDEIETMKIDTKDLPSGVYFVQVEVDGGCEIKKVIKIK